jgi:hypothetical protein
MAVIGIHTIKEMIRRGKEKRKDRNYMLDLPKIKSDGNNLMRIAKSRTVSRSLPYATFKISDTTTVDLCCNQDRKTASIANKAAKQLLDIFLEADLKESTKILDMVVSEDDLE